LTLRQRLDDLVDGGAAKSSSEMLKQGWRPMSRTDKTLEKVRSGRSDNNIRFSDLLSLLRSLGFEERIEGSHHIFTRPGSAGLIDLQPLGDKAKGYQVRQVRRYFEAHNIGG
jgi:hypothetical protein